MGIGQYIRFKANQASQATVDGKTGWYIQYRGENYAPGYTGTIICRRIKDNLILKIYNDAGLAYKANLKLYRFKLWYNGGLRASGFRI